MGRELEVFSDYVFESETHYYGTGKGVQIFAKILANNPFCPFEAPDLYVKSQDYVFIIEHFEFSSYKETRKGSTYRQEEARIQRKSDNVIPTTKPVVLDDVIHGESSYQNYVDNVLKAFQAHYLHIDEYIHNLRCAGVLEQQQVKVMFLIEDVSPLGSVVGNNGWDPSIKLVTLAHCKEFLNILRVSPRVDYVIACSSYSSQNYSWFIDNHELDVYYANAEDFAVMNFISFRPHVITAKIAIEDELN